MVEGKLGWQIVASYAGQNTKIMKRPCTGPSNTHRPHHVCFSTQMDIFINAITCYLEVTGDPEIRYKRSTDYGVLFHPTALRTLIDSYYLKGTDSGTDSIALLLKSSHKLNFSENCFHSKDLLKGKEKKRVAFSRNWQVQK